MDKRLVKLIDEDFPDLDFSEKAMKRVGEYGGYRGYLTDEQVEKERREEAKNPLP